MNCPSRTDDTLLNPGWNQNPPPLAADLTTREDLGNIANARQYRDHDISSIDDDRLPGIGTVGMSLVEPSEGGVSPRRSLVADELDRGRARPIASSPTDGTSGMQKQLQVTPSYGFRSSSKTDAVLEPEKLGLKATWTWISGFCQPRALLTVSILFNVLALVHMSGHDSLQGMGIGDIISRIADSFGARRKSNIAPLRKRGVCGNADGGGGPDYDLPLHVGAVFIILFVSFTACVFPMLALMFPRLRIPRTFLFFARHFGTGVLIATAFVHLLPTAFILLGDPCLSGFWTDDYPAMPGAIAMAAVFFVTVIEMVFSPAQHLCAGSQGMQAITREPSHVPSELGATDDQAPPKAGARHTRWASPVRAKGPLLGRSNSLSRRLSQLQERNEDADDSHIGPAPIEHVVTPEKFDVESKGGSFEEGVFLTEEQKNKKGIMQCMLLELGILFHSVFIGMALSVSRSNEFVVLLIAITFHQLFEGLALGSRIADLTWPKKSFKPWLMALAYGCTTPVGQAIGLATHNLYDPDSEVGLLLVGIMNAISAGLLVYASLIELLSEDFLSDESWRVLRGKRRVYACILVFLGAVGMSLVGAWA